MKSNQEFKGKIDEESSDEYEILNADDVDSDDSDVSMSDSSSESDSEVQESVNIAPSTSEENEAGPSNQEASTSNTEREIVLDEDEEDDEVIKAIIKSRELHRDHPPDISLEDTLADICFHPIRDMIALASITGDVLMYKYDNNQSELVSTIELHQKACRDIEFDEDGAILYSTGKDKAIMLTDVETEKLVRVIENAHENPTYCLSVIDQNTFATGDEEGVVRLWDRRQNSDTPVFSLKEMDDYVSSIVTNDDKKFLVCASGDGTLTTLNIRAKKLHVRTEDYPQELTCLGLFKHGRKILAGGSKGNLFLFNWGEFGLHSDEIPSSTKKSINCMIPITETVVVTGGEDKFLRATSLFPNRQLGIVGQHDLSVECLDISNNGTIIGSYSYDNKVKFWNVGYFETLNVTESIKGGKQKQLKHNLPSSKLDNASDFFAEL